MHADRAAPAPVRRLAAHGARDAPDARRAHLPAVRRARDARVRHAVASMPGICQLSVDEAVKEAQAPHAASGVPAVLLFAAPERQGRARQRGARSAGAGRRRPSARSRQPAPSCWCGRTCACAGPPITATAATCRRTASIDNDSSRRDARAGRAQLRARRRGCRGAERHDGWTRAARSARSSTRNGQAHTPIVAYAAKYASAFYGPFREAARVRARLRRSALVPDGSRQRARSAARGAARHRGGRRPRHGEARRPLSRRHPPGARCGDACRWSPTRSQANTASSRRRPSAAGSTSARRRSKPSPASAARAPISSSATSRRR